MPEAEETETVTEKTKPNKKGKLIIILIVILALGGGIGGTWYYMQSQIEEYEGDEPKIPKKKPITFIALDIFTVNLQPEENNSYLQVGLTVKAHETEVIEAINRQMPEIRNRILLLLSSKQAAEISTIIGKQQLSSDITNEIKQVFDSEEMQNDIVDVLFTSFVIQ